MTVRNWLESFFRYSLLIAGVDVADDPDQPAPGLNFASGATAAYNPATNNFDVSVTSSGGGPAGGSLAGTYPNPTVKQVDGTGTSAVVGVGTALAVGSNETTLGTPNGQGFSQVVGWTTGNGATISNTTDGTTWLTVATLTPKYVAEWGDETITAIAADQSSGNIYRADFLFSYKYLSGAFTLYPTTPTVSNGRGDSSLSTVALQVVSSSGSLLVQVKGVAATSINWHVIGQHQRL